MSEDLYLPLQVGKTIEASYNDGSTFNYSPSGNAQIGSYTLSYSGNYYYTYYAATAERGSSSTATNTDVNGSICPRGWRIPPANIIPSTFSWQQLVNIYNLTYSLSTQNPTSFKLSGQIYPANRPQVVGSGVIYLSSTTAANQGIYGFYITRGTITVDGWESRVDRGDAVRCVALR